ncbi:hypothetical protein SLEP1_g28562 [Rubroshorea leprosula]|uniref:Uncharacterized protein n=1 Tax=Rubroshorea leprosula TaxID=152421 RepID=A0AAV5K165_9ROSI|nr:hypothetical protein SLEP1_g28562 [Rubroshorea leprosula]
MKLFISNHGLISSLWIQAVSSKVDKEAFDLRTSLEEFVVTKRAIVAMALLATCKFQEVKHDVTRFINAYCVNGVGITRWNM